MCLRPMDKLVRGLQAACFELGNTRDSLSTPDMQVHVPPRYSLAMKTPASSNMALHPSSVSLGRSSDR